MGHVKRTFMLQNAMLTLTKSGHSATATRHAYMREMAHTHTQTQYILSRCEYVVRNENASPSIETVAQRDVFFSISHTTPHARHFPSLLLTHPFLLLGAKGVREGWNSEMKNRERERDCSQLAARKAPVENPRFPLDQFSALNHGHSSTLLLSTSLLRGSSSFCFCTKQRKWLAPSRIRLFREQSRSCSLAKWHLPTCREPKLKNKKKHTNT